MKKLPKTKNINKKKSLKKKANQSLVKLSHPDHKVLRHFRLLKSRHSFKILHHKHTAHLPLFLVLLLFGLFLFADQSHVVAQDIVKSGSVTIGAIIPGDPPAVGALILSPVDGAVFESNETVVSGSCFPETVVVIYNNSISAGSTFCTAEGIFSIPIQINVGQNALQALNFDSINQPGPETPTVTVIVEQPEPEVNTPIVIITPVLPRPSPIAELENPIIIPPASSSKNLCDNYSGDINTSIGGPLVVSIVCVVRGMQVGQQSQIGITVHGGQPPYAVNINLGDDSSSTENDILLSISKPGYKTASIKYEQAGNYILKLKSKDVTGAVAITQTVIEVHGVVGLTNFASIKDTIEKTSWLNTSVPAYLLVLVLTVGFWIGDVFDRRFSESKTTKRRLKTT